MRNKLLKVVSKPQIMFESKARGGEKAEHTRKCVSPPEADRHFEPTRNLSVLWRTQLSGIRGGFETIYKEIQSCP
ncbi:hypothetical protein ACFL7E_02265 [Thermodesulfobacteriota bacterium]